MRPELERQLDQIPNMSREALHGLWLRLFGRSPHPKLRREILVPILMYRAQEKALGGLKLSTARRLKAIAEEIESGKKGKGTTSISPKSGTRMVRQWQGKLHEVVAVDKGFIYEGKGFRSLSEIARLITGTRWSGPAFFGLKKRSVRKAA
jgi:hypothetical protein